MTRRVRAVAAGAALLMLCACIPPGRPPATEAAPPPAARPQAQSAGAIVERIVFGSVTYRERIALLPDAVVEVDAIDEAGRLVGRTRVVTDGLQVPIRFDLRARVAERGMLRLDARISDAAGTRLFAMAEPRAIALDSTPALLLTRVAD